MRGFYLLLISKKQNTNIYNVLIPIFEAFSQTNCVFLPMFIGKNNLELLFLLCAKLKSPPKFCHFN
jgi:hypothetical protein